jgi:hypothetical protein
MELNVIVLVVLGIVNVPVYVAIGKAFFGGWTDFWDAVRFLATPDVFSAIRGEYMADWWAEAKLGIFIAVCGGCVYGEYRLIQDLFLL